MSGLQRMPWIAVFSARDEMSTTFWRQCILGPCSGHRKGTVTWVACRMAPVVPMPIRTGEVIQCQTTNVESQQGIVTRCNEGKNTNETGFALEPSSSEVLRRVELRVLTSLLRTPVKQQRWILIVVDVAVFQTHQLALSNSSPAYWLSIYLTIYHDHFQDEVRYWPKIVTFFIPPPLRSIATLFMWKLE